MRCRQRVSLYSTVQRKKKNEVPVLPSAVFQLQQQIDDPNATPEQLVATIKQNPILAIEIMDIARNMKRGVYGNIKTIEHAVVYIGRQTLKMVALMGAIKAYKFHTKLYTNHDYWLEALLTGSIAAQLVEKFAPALSSEEVFLEGALANIGKAIGAIMVPKEVDAVWEYIRKPNTACNWYDAEAEVGASKHTVLGDIAAALWGLPPTYKRSITEHHNLNRILLQTTPTLSSLDLIATAIPLAHWLLADSAQISQSILQRFAKRTDLDEKELDQLVEQLQPLRVNVEAILADRAKEQKKAS